ncbi:hypothetical protein J7399_01375 [Shimia sp. R9_1]|uniref:hypothetical protein n=1 Tax=Shimia sp. R9_1 TaxID=2821111 RepID=UPI001ADC52E7|nr:hypothetical protein [Shimia sp. R9_1]MBO9406062.1 hypothetical protein [Shimia sp. R9_1]
MLPQTDETEVLATIRASGPRRVFGIGTLALLGGLLVYLALATSPALIWQVFLLVLGVLSLWLAESTRRATENTIQLTRAGMATDSGEVIAPLNDIAAVKRGMFDLKPSNGFTVVLKTSRTRRWQPGLWWALGKRVGIGGVTPGSEAKSMAQILEALLVEKGGSEI